MRGSDRGSAALWMLGLSLLLLVFGGLALDFWRGLALQRELAAIADSAAVAGASGIDEEVYRSTGELVLAPDRAQDLALTSIGFQDAPVSFVDVVLDPSSAQVTVVVEGIVELGLLGVFVDDGEPLLVRASATAFPRLVP